MATKKQTLQALVLMLALGLAGQIVVQWHGARAATYGKQIGGGSGGGGGSVGGLKACVASVSNITLSGIQTIDGFSADPATACNRILVVGETDATTNGIYTPASGAWTRTSDFATAAQMIYGTPINVASGISALAGSVWTFSTQSAVTVGTTALTFSQDNGAGAACSRPDLLAQARRTDYARNTSSFGHRDHRHRTSTQTGLDCNAQMDD